MIATRLTDLLGVSGTAPECADDAPGRWPAGAGRERGGRVRHGRDRGDRHGGRDRRTARDRRATAPPVPFGIGLVAWVIEQRPELLEIAIAARPTLISISFGDAGAACRPAPRGGHPRGLAGAEPTLGRGRARGRRRRRRRAGHRGRRPHRRRGTLPLLQIVLEMTDRPVVAAGGIASGRGLAAVLAAGAAGAWIGTPFLLAEEARNSPRARERIVQSDETETLYTSVYDRLQDKSWPAEFRARAIRNPFGARWTGGEDELGAGTAPRRVRPGARQPRTTTSRTSMRASRSGCSMPCGRRPRSSRTSRLRRKSCSSAGRQRSALATQRRVDGRAVAVPLPAEVRVERAGIETEPRRADDDPRSSMRPCFRRPRGPRTCPRRGRTAMLTPPRRRRRRPSRSSPLSRTPSAPQHVLLAGEEPRALHACRRLRLPETAAGSRARGCGRWAPSPRSRDRRPRASASARR